MRGLTSEEAKRRLAQYGANVLPEKQRFSAVSIFIHQFTSPLIFVLLGATVVTVILGDLVDAAVIGAAVVINTVLGFIQEYRAETTIAALKNILTPQAKVIRDGKTMTIPAAELVPGDVVLLSAGDRVSADGRAVEAVSLFINEAILTGESMPVEKRQTENGKRKTEEDKDATVFMGTVVASGRGKMEVAATGSGTVIGRMAKTIGETKKEATPLQKEIGRLARGLAFIVLVLCGLLFLLGLYYGQELVTMLTTSVAVAVSAIPEGLVVSLTVILAIGMQRVMRKKALVRRMVAAETLGSVSTICVDKTGTITQGVMQVVKHDVTDVGIAVKAAVIANNLEDPLEVALWDWARSQDHIDPQKITDSAKRLAEVPFDSIKKHMAVTTDEGVWVKGAPEVAIGMSRLSDEERHEWLAKVTAWGSKGLRVIALLHNKTFLGIIGISDPVREGVAEAVAHVQKAGVAVTMVTGDYRATAEAVLASIGIPIQHASREIMEGSELAAITREELTARVRDIRLFCRVSPEAKHKIVAALQAAGEVVAMTGDGVNDALALKKSDIGIVVKAASDVAKETADVVLLDSNFSTIVAAVEEGRAIFTNIRKVTLYLLLDVFVEVGIIAGAIITGLPLPLTALQILWINLVDDGLPSLALTVDPPARDLMRHSPRLKGTPIVNSRMKRMIAVTSIATAILSLGLFVWAIGTNSFVAAQTMVFTLVAVDSLLYVFSCRRIGGTLRPVDFVGNRWLIVAVAAGFSLQLFAVYHPWGNHAFGTVPLPLATWGIILGASGVIVGMIEGVKRVYSAQ